MPGGTSLLIHSSPLFLVEKNGRLQSNNQRTATTLLGGIYLPLPARYEQFEMICADTLALGQCLEEKMGSTE